MNTKEFNQFNGSINQTTAQEFNKFIDKITVKEFKEFRVLIDKMTAEEFGYFVENEMNPKQSKALIAKFTQFYSPYKHTLEIPSKYHAFIEIVKANERANNSKYVKHQTSINESTQRHGMTSGITAVIGENNRLQIPDGGNRFVVWKNELSITVFIAKGTFEEVFTTMNEISKKIQEEEYLNVYTEKGNNTKVYKDFTNIISKYEKIAEETRGKHYLQMGIIKSVYTGKYQKLSTTETTEFKKGRLKLININDADKIANQLFYIHDVVHSVLGYKNSKTKTYKPLSRVFNEALQMIIHEKGREYNNKKMGQKLASTKTEHLKSITSNADARAILRELIGLYDND